MDGTGIETETFISGPAIYHSNGSYLTPPGDDRNYPKHASRPIMPSGQGGSWYTNTYKDEPDEEEGLPFHLCCYRDVLLQPIRNYGIINKPTIPAVDEIDTQTLRRMLHGNEEILHRGFFFVGPEDTRYDDGSLSHALKLDYGARANDKL